MVCIESIQASANWHKLVFPIILVSEQSERDTLKDDDLISSSFFHIMLLIPT